MRVRMLNRFLLPKFVILFVVFLWAFGAQATSIDPCQDNEISFNGYLLQTHSTGTKADSTCMIYLARKTTENKYKRLIWNSDGKFMVFLSQGDGSDALNTGAKSYYFLPQKNPLQLELIDHSRLIVTTVNNVQMMFNTTTGLFENISGVRFSHNLDASIYDPNWIQIESTEEIIFELEFEIGGSPSENLMGQLKVHSPLEPCEALHLHLFQPQVGEPTLRIKTEVEVNSFLQRNCRHNLQLSTAQTNGL